MGLANNKQFQRRLVAVMGGNGLGAGPRGSGSSHEDSNERKERADAIMEDAENLLRMYEKGMGLKRSTGGKTTTRKKSSDQALTPPAGNSPATSPKGAQAKIG